MADWCINTCLTFGTSVSTAYKVAGLLAEALENDGLEVDSEELKPPLDVRGIRRVQTSSNPNFGEPSPEKG